MPHVIDTLLFATGIAMLFMLSLNPFTQPWLIAKFVALIAYILLGTIALKRGPSKRIRVVAYVCAIATFGYIAGSGLERSPLSWLA